MGPYGLIGLTVGICFPTGPNNYDDVF